MTRQDATSGAPDGHAPATGSRQAAWALTLDISLRGRVRTYDRPLPDGTWANSTRDTPAGPDAPDAPWAVYLGDGTGYQLACFDFDAHDGSDGARRQADEDATACARILETHGIPSLVCESGPTGGRHVWASTLDTIEAGDMKAIAIGMRAMCPSLDITPLCNPRTGCARPPYAPHRLGGASRPIRGSIDAIDTPVAGEDEWLALMDDLATPDTRRTHDPVVERGIAHDAQAMPCLPGTRRDLPHASRILLDQPVGPGTDASRVLRAILIGAAASHWQWPDVLALLDQARPGMTHALTRRATPQGPREPRPATGPHSPGMVLAREWRSAVAWVAGHATHATGDDPEWRERAARTTDTIRRALDRLAHTPDTRATPSDTRVLKALCLLALRAARDTIEADVRRLGLMTGLSIWTVSHSLHRLERQGLVRLARKAEGPRANTWQVLPGTPTDACIRANPNTSKHTPRVSHALLALRDTLADTLTAWLDAAGHDACRRQGLGIREGNHIADRYAHTSGETRTTARLDRLARALGTLGIRARQAAQYATDRLLWHWYLKELEWMRAPRGRKPRRTREQGAPTGRMPRTTRHRIDWARALRAVQGAR